MRCVHGRSLSCQLADWMSIGPRNGPRLPLNAPTSAPRSYIPHLSRRNIPEFPSVPGCAISSGYGQQPGRPDARLASLGGSTTSTTAFGGACSQSTASRFMAAPGPIRLACIRRNGTFGANHRLPIGRAQNRNNSRRQIRDSLLADFTSARPGGAVGPCHRNFGGLWSRASQADAARTILAVCARTSQQWKAQLPGSRAVRRMPKHRSSARPA